MVWPDGGSVVYAMEQPSGRMRLERLDLRTGMRSFLHDDPDASERELTVSADGNIHAYNQVKGGPGLFTDMWVVRRDPPARVKVPAEAQWSSFPSLSADGRRVAFSETGQTLHVFDVDFDDPDFRAETDDGRDEKKRKEMEERRKNARGKALKAGALRRFKGDYPWPRLSPDGAAIVCGAHRSGDFEIVALAVAEANEKLASKETRLTTSPGIDVRPAWSPDGRRIAFTSNRDGNFEIYVMESDGSRPRRVTRHPERDDFATWHPDGNRLVFVGERDGSLDLYEVGLDAE